MCSGLHRWTSSCSRRWPLAEAHTLKAELLDARAATSAPRGHNISLCPVMDAEGPTTD